jgi:hypothetical protein
MLGRNLNIFTGNDRLEFGLFKDKIAFDLGSDVDEFIVKGREPELFLDVVG